MQKFLSIKTVSACEITKISIFWDWKWFVIPVKCYKLIFKEGFRIVSSKFFKKHKPSVGGYFVVYEDGYTSFSPKRVFNEGYVSIGNPHNRKNGDTTRMVDMAVQILFQHKRMILCHEEPYLTSPRVAKRIVSCENNSPKIRHFFEVLKKRMYHEHHIKIRINRTKGSTIIEMRP